ncbi:MAG: DMT family transporter [Massiliimalia sp.]|jgi:drug/metabolite transporter (DMT)-like permease
MIENFKTRKSNDSKSSITLLHLSVMLFGLSAVLGQFVDAPAVIIAGGRVIFSSVTLLIFSFAVKNNLKLRCKKDYGIALLTGVILAVHWTTFFQSIQSSSVAIGTITFSAFPLFLTFLEPLVFHEKLHFRSVMSAVVLLLGVGITVPTFSLENETTMGIVWGLISALAYAVMSLSNRYLSKFYPSRTICLYEQGTAAIVLLPALFLIQTNWTVENLAGIAMIGLVCTALAHSLYVAAQRNVKAQTAGVISGMETVYGILFAFLFLKEVPGLRELIGGAIILGVAVFSSLTSSKK